MEEKINSCTEAEIVDAIGNNEPLRTEEIPAAFCKNCGVETRPGERYCYNCGADQLVERQQEPVQPVLPEPQKKKVNKLLIGIIAGAAVLALALALFFIIRGTPVKEIQLIKDEITMDIGNTASVAFTINPSDAKNKQVTWYSTNDSVATVDSLGIITAVDAGVCNIIVKTSNGKTDDVKVTVKEHIPNFTEMFNSYEPNDWCEIAADGSWLSIDTNPKDYDSDDYDFLFWYIANGDACMDAIQEINTQLGFTSAVYKRMTETTALQGRQFDENDNYKVSWTYHPDKGLEVTYEVKGN